MIKAEDLGRVVVLMGGKSTEKDVSRSSGSGVLAALKSRGVQAEAFDPGVEPLEKLAAGHYDRAFNMLHGLGGEDGTIQGVLEWLRIPYTGSGVLASALAIDKNATCKLWQSEGVPVPEGMLVESPDQAGEVIARLGRSLVVKPDREGSSFGVVKLEDATEEMLAEAIRTSGKLDHVLVEKRLHGREFTVAVLGEGASAHALPVIEIIAPGGDYNCVNKYQGNDVKYACPADLPEELAARIQADVVKGYRAVGARGWGRIDVMLDADGSHALLEINTNPGMTPHSLVPMAARAVGLSYEDLVMKVAAEARLD